jgi:hypothetical protein
VPMHVRFASESSPSRGAKKMHQVAFRVQRLFLPGGSATPGLFQRVLKDNELPFRLSLCCPPSPPAATRAAGLIRRSRVTPAEYAPTNPRAKSNSHLRVILWVQSPPTFILLRLRGYFTEWADSLSASDLY